MIEQITQQLKTHLDLSFSSVKDSLESVVKVVLLVLEAYAVYWVLTAFAWQPVLPVYQWY